MEERLSVGIVGCGRAGEEHARAYSSISGVRVLAVADIDEGKARDLARKCGADTSYRDYNGILEDPRIDAVSICLPHYLHSKVSVEAAEAGKHILCEKPMANNLDEADEMIRAAKKAGVTLMIAENVRFHPINLKLKELIEQNHIGEVFLARIFRDHEMHAYLRKRPWFLSKEKAGGGIWMAGGVHDVDALRMLIGEVKTVSLFQAKRVFREMEGDDTVAAILRFRSDALGVVTESFSTKTFGQPSPHGCPSVINGSSGTITVVSDEIKIYGEKVGNTDGCIRIKVEERDTFIEEIKHFRRCIEKGVEPVTSGEEERRTLAVVCAGYESLDMGGVPVEVNYQSES
ncbi:MAG: Gfo/Idh/MocA family protein [Candidatus Bathyarchaeia archaeon]